MSLLALADHFLEFDHVTSARRFARLRGGDLLLALGDGRLELQHVVAVPRVALRDRALELLQPAFGFFGAAFGLLGAAGEPVGERQRGLAAREFARPAGELLLERARREARLVRGHLQQRRVDLAHQRRAGLVQREVLRVEGRVAQRCVEKIRLEDAERRGVHLEAERVRHAPHFAVGVFASAGHSRPARGGCPGCPAGPPARARATAGNSSPAAGRRVSAASASRSRDGAA